MRKNRLDFQAHAYIYKRECAFFCIMKNERERNIGACFSLNILPSISHQVNRCVYAEYPIYTVAVYLFQIISLMASTTTGN